MKKDARSDVARLSASFHFFLFIFFLVSFFRVIFSTRRQRLVLVSIAVVSIRRRVVLVLGPRRGVLVIVFGWAWPLPEVRPLAARIARAVYRYTHLYVYRVTCVPCKCARLDRP